MGKKAAVKVEPESLRIASKGIRTAHDFSNFMSALMGDLISGRVTPNVGNATCNAGGKLLKAAEMQVKYGTNGNGNQGRVLVLAPGTGESPLVEQQQK